MNFRKHLSAALATAVLSLGAPALAQGTLIPLDPTNPNSTFDAYVGQVYKTPAEVWANLGARIGQLVSEAIPKQVNIPGGIAGLNDAGAYVGLLSDNVRSGGSDKGTDISQAYVAQSSPLSSYLTASATHRFTVYLGGVSHFPALASDVQSSLAAGNITLYEHGDSVSPVLLSTAQRQAIQSVWGVTGVKITAASGGGGTGMAELGCCGVPAAYDLSNFGGAFPALATINLPDELGGDANTGQMTDANEATLEQKLGAIASAANSSRSIAPFMRPDSSKTNIWSTDAMYAPARKLALATGAVALDMPPTLALSGPSSVLDNYADEIKWAITNHLRMTVVVSPFVLGLGGCTFDPSFIQNTKTYITYLLSKAPPPTEWAVEDYCDPTTAGQNANGSTGDSVSESNNQVALYLSTLPVSPAGTAVPKIAGGLSEADALSIYGLYSAANQTAFTFDAPYAKTQNPMPMNDLRNRMKYSLDTLGGLAYQNPMSVTLYGGNIFSQNPLNITNTNGKYISQGSGSQIVVTGNGGNTVITSSSYDRFLGLYDPYTNKGAGIHFGDPSKQAPTFYANNMTGSATGMTLEGTAEALLTLHQSSSPWYGIGPSATTGKFIITNLSSALDGGTGIQWAPPGVAEADRPDISSSKDGTTLTYTAKTSAFTGSTSIGGNSTVSGTTISNGDIIAKNDIDLASGKALALGSGNPAYLTGDGSGNSSITGTFGVATSGLADVTGLYVGTKPSGFISAFGVYAASGYGRDLVDIVKGTTTVFKVDNSGGVSASNGTFTSLTGTGNAYACLNAAGQLYRSATACN